MTCALFCDIFHINWIVLSTGEFRCYITAKQTIPSTELDISELTAGSLARIVMILIEAQMETTLGDLCPPFRDIPRSLI